MQDSVLFIMFPFFHLYHNRKQCLGPARPHCSSKISNSDLSPQSFAQEFGSIAAARVLINQPAMKQYWPSKMTILVNIQQSKRSFSQLIDHSQLVNCLVN